jgi:hypothetical protein
MKTREICTALVLACFAMVTAASAGTQLASGRYECTHGTPPSSYQVEVYTETDPDTFWTYQGNGGTGSYASGVYSGTYDGSSGQFKYEFDVPANGSYKKWIRTPPGSWELVETGTFLPVP